MVVCHKLVITKTSSETISIFGKKNKWGQQRSPCQRHQNLNGLILNKNPLVCDCDENTWWSSIDETNSISPTDLFEFNENVCFEIKDYEKLGANK